MTEATSADRAYLACVATSHETYSVRRLNVEVPGVREFQRLYEQAVPPNPVEEIVALEQRGASWAEVIDLHAEIAPHGFLVYWRNDVHGVMELAHDEADCIAYLMGNVTIAEQMFRHDPRAMLYAPLRTAIWEDAHGHAWFTVDQPSTQFASLGIPRGLSRGGRARQKARRAAGSAPRRGADGAALLDRGCLIKPPNERTGMSPQNKPSIVFCHGLWADGSCFSKLIPALRADGHEVITAEYGLDSAQGDVDCVLRALGRVSGPAILVGHSYGGSVITAAGIDDRVAGLVYIAALAPDEEETSQSQQDKFPATDVFAHIEVADNRVWLLEPGIDCFAGDLTEEEKQVVWATAMSPVADLFNQKVQGVAWRTKPSAYIVANNDHTVNPDLERFAANRMGATTYDVDSSHVPMLSHPEFVLDVIRNAAAAVQGSAAVGAA